MITLKEEIDCHMLARINAEPFGEFCPGVMADTLRMELEDSWYTMPATTKAVMIGVAAELKREYAHSVMADIKAAHLVDHLKRTA